MTFEPCIVLYCILLLPYIPNNRTWNTKERSDWGRSRKLLRALFVFLLVPQIWESQGLDIYNSLALHKWRSVLRSHKNRRKWSSSPLSGAGDTEGHIGSDLWWLLVSSYEQCQARDQQKGRIFSLMSLESILTFTDVSQKEVSKLHLWSLEFWWSF